MAIINTTIPNLIGGISQQPDRLKFDGQCNDSLNCYATVKDGLKKRPYSKFVKNLGFYEYDDHAFPIFINRSINERYVGLYDNTRGLKIWNLDTGNEATITGNQAYLNVGNLNPDTTLKALTVSDYTFITNRSVTVNLGNSTSPALDREAIVFIKQGDFQKDYTITLDNTDYTYTTGNNENGSNADTEKIARNLRDLINGSAGYTAVSAGNIIKIERVDGNDFNIRGSDGLGGRGLEVVYKKVDDITDLPLSCYNGFRVEVSGSGDTSDDDYWVEFETADNTGFGEGSWIETVAPSTTRNFNAGTMPITLINTGVDTFELENFNWANRAVGDNITNPAPSFVGSQINDVFFYKNRLGFISDENVIFSEAGKFRNFWRTSVQQLLDSAPIDVSVSHTKVAFLRHAVATSSRLILFSDRTQFALKGDELLTNLTVSITPVTNFENDLNVTPTTIGRYTYFGFQRGQYTGIREYYLDNLVNDFDQNEITSHVPNLVPQDLKTITGTTSEDHIAFLPRNSKEFFLYSYYWNGNEKAMSSWSRHDLECDFIVAFEFIDSDLYLITSEKGYLHLQYMPWEQGLSDGVIFEEGTTGGGFSLIISGLSQSQFNGAYSDNGNFYNGASQYEQNGGTGVIRKSSTTLNYWQIFDTDSNELIATSVAEAFNPWEVIYWIES